MNARIRSLALNLLLLAASVLLVLGGAEIFLRVFPQYLPPLARLKLHWVNLPGTVSHADRELGFLYPANYHGRVKSGEIDFSYTTDGTGFRNPRPCPDSSAAVVVGDSEVFGYGVDDSLTWTSLAAAQLGGACITNLGLPGMSPRQYLRAYRRFGMPLHPRVLVLGLFPGNDLGDEQQFIAWEAAGSPGNYDVWRFFEGRPPGVAGTVSRLTERSYLVWFLRDVRRQMRDRMGPAPAPVVFPDGHKLQLTRAEFRSQARLADPSNPTFRAVLDDIDQAQGLARAQRAEFLVLLLPTKEDVYLPLRGEEPPPMLPALRQALQERNLPLLDLTEPLQAAARRARVPLFFSVDGHPNAAGYRVIADAVAARLGPLLADSSAAGSDAR